MAYKYVNDIGRILTEQLDIEKVVSERVPLKRAGRNLKGLCPFHDEKTPSFVVSTERQSYHCFGCGEGGNALSFVMKTENLDFLTAVESLADRFGINLEPYLNDEKQAPRENLSVYYDMNRLAASHFYLNLKNDEEARQYLYDRGITDKTIKAYGLGLAKDDWQDLHRHYGSFDNKEINNSGLFSESKGRTFDRFRNRIIFPIIDLRKRVVGFGGRIFHGEKEAKYLNSPDTPVFNKSYHLYGLNIAKNHRETKCLLLVEGYMDVIALYEHGIKNAVASLGTAFTQEQAKLMHRYTERVKILYDGDEAGTKATLKAMEILKQEGLDVYVVPMKEGEDPDSLVRQLGAEGFLSFIEAEEQDVYGYELSLLIKDHDITRSMGRANYLKAAKEVLEKIDEKSIQNIYIKRLSRELEISESSIRADLKGIEEGRPIRRNVKVNPGLKMQLLKMAMEDSDIAHEMVQHSCFKYLNKNYQEILLFIDEHRGYNIQLATEVFSLEVLESLEGVRQIKLEKDFRKYWRKQYHRFLRDILHQKLKEIQQDGALDTDEESPLLEYFQALQQIKE